MIIWLASYPRSGNTLLRMMLNSVFGRTSYSEYDDVTDIGADPQTCQRVGHVFLGRPLEQAYAELSATPEPVFIKTHNEPKDDAKAIYIVRDGRFAAMSYHRYLKDFLAVEHEVSLVNVIAGFTQFGSWGSHLDAWDPQNRPNTLLLRYEDLVAEPQREIAKIAEFIQLEPTGQWQNDFQALHQVNPKFFRHGNTHADGNNCGERAAVLSPQEEAFFLAQHGDWCQRLNYPCDGAPQDSGNPKQLRRLIAENGERLFTTLKQFHGLHEQYQQRNGQIELLNQETRRLMDHARQLTAQLDVSEQQTAELSLRLTHHEFDGPNGPVLPSPAIIPPDLVWKMGDGSQYRRSWKGGDDAQACLNDEHAGIWQATQDLPGWQDPADSLKLYETAYHDGAIILEIGVYGGRSAVVELRGALRAQGERGGPRPQYYGVDLDPAAIPRSRKTIQDAGLDDHCLLYLGTLDSFCREIPITPTMVFVDGDHSYEGVKRDLAALAQFLALGTPVICHDYGGIEGVRQAINEAVAGGSYEAMGVFDDSALLRASGTCHGRVRGLPERIFQSQRRLLHDLYERMPGDLVDSTSQTLLARRVLDPQPDARGSGAGVWPFVRPESRPLPSMLPDGSPWPKISIITASFNQGQYIEETILSVLNQNYPNVEHIVMDGGSTDQTRAILALYENRLARVISEKDNGQSDAINKGMHLATGEIVTWLNSDDMLAPDALAGMAMAFHTSRADVVAGICITHKDGNMIGRHLTSCVNGPLPIDDLLDLEGCWMQGQFFYQPEVMFTRRLWERVGGHVDESLFYCMDYELWLRFAEAGARLHVIGRPTAWYRVHEQQKTFEQADFLPEMRKVRDAFVQRTGHAAPVPAPTPFKSQLRVCFFNDLGSVGGAAIAHQRLAEAVALAGHEVAPVGVAPNLIESRLSPESIVGEIGYRKPDLVVVGNLHSASLDPSLVGLIAARWPTVQVLHDLWPLTGRCAYPGDCTKYRTGCDSACPTAREYPPLEPSRISSAWETKYAALATGEKAPILAGVSAWTERLARERFTNEPNAPRIIGLRYGLPTDIFRPRDRAICRELLDLPRDRFIILFSSSMLSDQRKGLAHLLEALKQLRLPNLLMVCVGRLDLAPQENPAFRSLGYVSDPTTLAMIYSAADLFVGPSLIETFGQVFIEAAACGTPSVGYPAGGVSESIADGVSGRLAQRVDPRALAEAIKELHDDASLRRRMSVWGRIWVENQWSLASASQRWFAQLRAAGVMRALGVRPRLTLLEQPTRLYEVAYIEAQPQAKAVTSMVGIEATATIGEMRRRVACLEAERNDLRDMMQRMSDTWLWAMMERSRDAFSAVVNSKRLPYGVSKRLLNVGRRVAGGFERTNGK
jgi:glycosyltransferase involved in cell wall biosynthesis/GT2 family glycosyltransferase